ncbi:MAG: TIGR04282 family arsenosugar biosynthesis glycosyltransferase [Desulforhopalus sp.]
MTPAPDRLIVFTRYPKAGSTKTRLIPSLGAEGAAKLQQKLTEHVFREARRLEENLTAAFEVHYCGGTPKKMSAWLGPCTLVRQVEGDIGARMAAAFSHAFGAGTQKAILVGSDIPDISTRLLQQAFRSLSVSDVVLGPCHDGGYYLIGFTASEARTLLPLLFEKMPWSTKTLFIVTMKSLKAAGYTVATLPLLTDIDRPEDLCHARTKGFL